MVESLNDAIESLYAVFARYHRPAKIESCPCGCTEPDATEYLVAVPLRDLLFKDLTDYSFSAMTTQGAVDDFRYLLPRLLQGVAQEQIPVDPDIIFGKLPYAKWMDWPEDEIEAIRNYLRALWKEALMSFPLWERFPMFSEIETTLASIATTGEALNAYLQIWSETRAVSADQNLIQMTTMYGRDISDGKLFFERAFWRNSKSQGEAVRDWFLQTDTLLRIGGASHLLANDGFEHLFESAFEALTNQSRSLQANTG